MISPFIIVGGIVGITIAGAMCAWYRVVPPSEAHLVVTPNKKMVCSPDTTIQKHGGKSSYFSIPRIPFIGRRVRVMDVTIKEKLVPQETYEKNQARYNVTSSVKYRIKNVEVASETFISNESLERMLTEIIQSAVRAVTVNYDVREARAKKKLMSEEVKKEIIDDLSKWGLELVSFQMVDFKDTETSKIISNISKRREVEIEAETREMNAEKLKQARIKEAAAEESAKTREIAKDETVSKREQDKAKAVSEREKEAKEKEYEVIKVETIKQAEIDKEQAEIEAEKKKEVEKIEKERKQLEGEGTKLKMQQEAIGNAAEIEERGKAEAKAKELLQKALNKFGNNAIRALVAEKIVDKDKAIGMEGAKALQKAELKLFSGGDNGGAFDVGKALESLKVGSKDTAKSVLYNLARGTDLGFTGLKDNLPDLEGEDSKAKTAKEFIEDPKQGRHLEHPVKDKIVREIIKNHPTFGKIYGDIKHLNLGETIKDFADLGVGEVIEKLKNKFGGKRR